MFISSNLSKNGRGEKRTSFVKINSAFAYLAKAVIRASQFHPPAARQAGTPKSARQHLPTIMFQHGEHRRHHKSRALKYLYLETLSIFVTLYKD
jgi:hypothetical protein